MVSKARESEQVTGVLTEVHVRRMVFVAEATGIPIEIIASSPSTDLRTKVGDIIIDSLKDVEL